MLYGSLRERSFSRFLTYEAACILERFGAEVWIFDPMALPMIGSVPEPHPKVVELRASTWGRPSCVIRFCICCALPPRFTPRIFSFLLFTFCTLTSILMEIKIKQER